MAALPRVEVLLLNWNGWRDTIECLESVFALDYPDFGVTVCDNASTNGSVERIEAWARGELKVDRTFARSLGQDAVVSRAPVRFRILDRAAAEAGDAADDADLVIVRTGGNLGFAGGNNVGLRRILARGEARYVWLLNNDTVVAPDSLTHMVRRADSDAAIGVVGATVLEFDEPDVVQYLGGARFAPWRGRITLLGRGQAASAPRPEPADLDYVSGGCMLVRMSAVEQVGLLDERFFMYSEDADWCFCIREAGYRLALAADAEIWHKGGASSVPGSPLHDYHNMVGNLLVMRKHHPWHMPFTVPYSLYRYLAPRIVRGQWKRAAAVARAFLDVAFGDTGAPPSQVPSEAPPPRALGEPRVSTETP
ncbi:MAG TPA: glycosyltransferase family 2 protein [Gemmatimonadaceae bacterium]|nr:glycosyltransferase family 2 protein [Gemmatimonadaceae bacterium]